MSFVLNALRKMVSRNLFMAGNHLIIAGEADAVR